MPLPRRFVETVAFKQAISFSLLLFVFFALGIGVIYIHSYKQLGKSASERLSYQLVLFKNNIEENSKVKVDPQSIYFRIEKKDLPAELQVTSNTRKFLFLKKMKKLNALNGYPEIKKLNDFLLTAVEDPFDSNQVLFLGTAFHSRSLMLLVIKTSFYFFAVSFGAFLLFSYLIANRVLNQVDRIDQVAKAIVRGDLKKRIPVNQNKNDEISNLSKTVNDVLSVSENMVLEVKQVSNNIAHDLRGPLNRIKSRMEVSLLNTRDSDEYKAIIEQSLLDLDGLLQTFNSLLLIANIDSGRRNYYLEPFSLTQLLEDMAELYGVTCEETGHQFSSQITKGVFIRGERNLFAQAISNLLDNAIKYTPKGALVEICLQLKDEMAIVQVKDNGPGIDKDQRKDVFKRFYRVDPSRTTLGTGLGMSLVKSIVTLHNASIALHDNHPGLCVEINLAQLKRTVL